MKLVTVGFIVSLGICWAAIAQATDTSSVEGAWSGSDPANDVWKPVGPRPGAVESQVVADPATHTVYVATNGGGVLKSIDSGLHFTPANTGLATSQIQQLGIGVNDPKTLYAGAIDFLYVSHNAGATWTATSNFLSAFAIAIDPNDANTVYTGSSAIQVSHDGGATFTDITGAVAGVVFGMVLNPKNPLELFAGTTGGGAYHTIDGGANWAALSLDNTVWSWAIDSVDGTVYAGSNHGVFKSTDGGNTYAVAGSPGNGIVYSLTKSGEDLYAGTGGGGFWVSKDGGVTWKSLDIAKGIGLSLNTDSAGNVYAGTNFEGAFARHARDNDNHSDHWRPIAWDYIRNCNCQNGHAIAIDPNDDEHLFFTTNDGGLLESKDGGDNWSDLADKGLGARAPRGVGFDPRNRKRIYVGGYTGNGFWRTADGGKSWTQSFFGPPNVYTTQPVVDPIDGTVYVATLSTGVYKSTDFGATFIRIDQAPGSAPGVYLNIGGRGLAMDPNNRHTLFLAARGKGTWKTVDGGVSWVKVDPTFALSVTIDPSDSNVVYAAGNPAIGDPGVIKSIDGGNTFFPSGNGLPGTSQSARTGAVQVNPKDPSELYVGFEGDGVYTSSDAGATWASANACLTNTVIQGITMDLASPKTLYVSTSASVFKTRGERTNQGSCDQQFRYKNRESAIAGDVGRYVAASAPNLRL
jgi:photosystem II stability/assembly factor-like uncharacterized protein